MDLSPLPSDITGLVRDWLVRSATCGLRHQQVDLGPLHTPPPPPTLAASHGLWKNQTPCKIAPFPEGWHACGLTQHKYRFWLGIAGEVKREVVVGMGGEG